MAILLRFFEQRSFPEVGKHLGLSENAARMRVDRAVEKLGRRLRRRGITSGTAGILALLREQAVGSAPAGLGLRISRAVLAGVGSSVEIPLWTKLLSGTPWKAIGGGLIGCAALWTIVSSNLPDSGGLEPESMELAGDAAAVQETRSQSAGSTQDRSELVTRRKPAAEAALASEQGEASKLRLVLVTAAQGDPIPNGRIEYRIRRGGEYQSGDIAADENGKCELELPPELQRIELTTRIKGYADTRLAWRPEHGESIPNQYRLELREAVPIGGRVVGPDGDPVAGAKVGIGHGTRPSRTLRSESHEFGGIEVTTDGAGRWRIDRIAEEMIGRLQGLAKHPDYYRSPHFRVERQPKAEKKLRNESFIFQLRPTVTVNGKVTAPNGYPVADAEVLVGHVGQMSSRQGVTDAEGRFEIKGCAPGKRLVSAEAQGYAPTTRRVNLKEEARTIHLVLKEGKILRLQVVGSNGHPISGATVGLSVFAPVRTDFSKPKPVPVQTELSRETNQEGRLVWRNAPDTLMTFYARAPGYMDADDIRLRPNGEEHIIQLKPELTVHGTVTDAVTGKPIPSFRVGCGYPESGPDGEITPEWSPLERFWLNFADGTFRHSFDERIGGKENRAYILKFQADGYSPYISRVIGANEGVAELEVELEPASPTLLKIKAPSGNAARNADVGLVSPGYHLALFPPRILSESGDSVRTATEKGEIELYPDSSLHKLLVVHHSGLAEIPVDQLESSNVIRLQPWGRIDGILRDGDGELLEGRQITLRFANKEESLVALHADPDPTEKDYHAMTDEKGRFVFGYVPPGRFELVLKYKWIRDDGEIAWIPPESRMVRMKAGQERRLEIEWQSSSNANQKGGP